MILCPVAWLPLNPAINSEIYKTFVHSSNLVLRVLRENSSLLRLDFDKFWKMLIIFSKLRVLREDGSLLRLDYGKTPRARRCLLKKHQNHLKSNKDHHIYDYGKTTRARRCLCHHIRGHVVTWSMVMSCHVISSSYHHVIVIFMTMSSCRHVTSSYRDYAIILFMIMDQKDHPDRQQGQSSLIEDLSQGIHRRRGQRNGSLACCASRKKVFFIFFCDFLLKLKQ